MSRTVLRLALLLVLLLAAGCGQVPSPTPGQSRPATPAPTTTPGAYPPPPTAPTVPTLPLPTPEPTATPEPSPDLAPKLVVQPVVEEMRSGERIAFLRDGDLWLVRPDGSGLAQVTISRNVTALYGWSADCSHLLLGVGKRPVPPESDVPGGSDLWVLQPSGIEAKAIVGGLEVLGARWSPVRDQVIYQTRDYYVYVTDVGGATGQQLGDQAALLGSWSPDGVEVALLQLDPQTLGQTLTVVDMRVGVVRSLTDSGKNGWGDGHPLWSLDGQTILFQSTREEPHGWARWWTVSRTGGNLHLLTNDLLQEMVTSALRPSRSPVADTVLFAHYRFASDTPAVWVMDFDGSNLRELTKGANPTRSPDGRRVAYAGPEGGLWVINLDGSGASEVAAQGNDPVWFEPYWCR